MVLLLAGGGVGAYFLLKDDSSPSPSPTPSPVGPPVDPSASPSVSPSVGPPVLHEQDCIELNNNITTCSCLSTGVTCTGSYCFCQDYTDAGRQCVGSCKQNVQFFKDFCRPLYNRFYEHSSDSGIQSFLDSCDLN